MPPRIALCFSLLSAILILSLQSFLAFHALLFLSSSPPISASLSLPARFRPHSRIKDSFLSQSLRVPASLVRQLPEILNTTENHSTSQLPSRQGNAGIGDREQIGRIPETVNTAGNDKLPARQRYAAIGDREEHGKIPEIVNTSGNDGTAQLPSGQEYAGLGDREEDGQFDATEEGAEDEDFSGRQIDQVISNPEGNENVGEGSIVRDKLGSIQLDGGIEHGGNLDLGIAQNSSIVAEKQIIRLFDERGAENEELLAQRQNVESPIEQEHVSDMVEASFGMPAPNATLEERLEWLKLNWASFEVLDSDDLSLQFGQRMDAFLLGKGNKEEPVAETRSSIHESTEAKAKAKAKVNAKSKKKKKKKNKRNLLGLASDGDGDDQGPTGPCNMHFFITWISPLSLFGPRERLCMESVFRTHPSACLVIISRTLDSPAGRRILQPFSDRGFRVMAVAPDVPFLFQDTPAHQWFRDLKKGKIDPGEISFSQNLSNLLRLALLYKYGGIYIDSDTIVLRNFSRLSNVIGAQNVDKETGKWNRLNNAVMAFDKKHPLLFKFIQEFCLTFNGSKWGHNGPYLVSRVVTRVMTRPSYGCKVLPPSAFYPVNWERIDSFFRAPRDRTEEKWLVAKMLQLKRSFSIHMWNKRSREMEVEPGSIMELIFRKCCVFCDLQTHKAALRAQS